jgi:hypothetical protein
MNGARIRLPVWTDRESQKPYVALVAELADDWTSVVLIGDADTRRVRMASADYLALPYYFFELTGPAPRPVLVRLGEAEPL